MSGWVVAALLYVVGVHVTGEMLDWHRIAHPGCRTSSRRTLLFMLLWPNVMAIDALVMTWRTIRNALR